MNELRANFSATEISVWTTAWDCAPDNISSLALAGKIQRCQAYEACGKLASLGWMLLSEEGRCLRPIAFVTHAMQDKMATELEESLAAAPHKCEFLMKSYLDLAVFGHDYIDNARLDVIKNVTGHNLELDRYYRVGVAFEYNGPQHFGPTFRYPDAKAARDQQKRDAQKLWLCQRAGIRLTRIQVDQLHPIMMSQLIPDELPRNHVDEDGPYYKALCSLCNSMILTATGVNAEQVLAGKGGV